MKKAIEYIRYYQWRFIAGLAKRFHVFKVYRTKIGIKQLNMGLLTRSGRYVGSEIELSADQLFLGPDFMIDDYTLLDMPLTQSPHVQFMKDIENGKDPSMSLYFQLYRDGMLDWRYPQSPVCNRKIYEEKYAKSRLAVENHEYDRVIVYKVDERYYVYDGKHRAAMCACLSKPIKCLLVDNTIAWANTFLYLFAMLEGDNNYHKHILFLQKVKNQV